MPHPEHAVDPDVGPTGGQPLFALAARARRRCAGRGRVSRLRGAPCTARLGLTDDEFDAIVGTLGREPGPAELAMYGAMWSEHCSYKSSKVHLQNAPHRGRRRPGGAGPGRRRRRHRRRHGRACSRWSRTRTRSAIEPYQGAATGVGGIVRDIISMGARPVALLDPLMFGPLDEARNRWLLGGVVAGIGGYGNCIGVPTVGGEVQFAEPHTANPTVNVMCVGLARADELVTCRVAAGARGFVMVLYGAATGRDGIGGVQRAGVARRSDEASHGVAALRADRRPVRREAADRGVAGADPTRACSRPCRTWAAAGITCAVERVGGARPGWAPTWTSTPCRCASRGWSPSRS